MPLDHYNKMEHKKTTTKSLTYIDIIVRGMNNINGTTTKSKNVGMLEELILC